MPVNATLMKSLKKKYGPKKGEQIYYSMEKSGSPSFQKGLKTAEKEGHVLGGKKKKKKKS